MDKANFVSRRFVMASVGAISGLLGALGVQIVLTQGGHITASFDLGIPLAGFVGGATFGFLLLPKWLDRLITISIALVGILVVSLALAQPALAQSSCGGRVTIGQLTTPLSVTSSREPLVIDLGRTTEISFAGTTGDIEEGTVEVSVQSVSPLGFLIEPGGTVIYYDTVASSASGSTLQIHRSGPTGFVIRSPSFESPVLPLGLVELDIIVRHAAFSAEDCAGKAWVRFVAQPVSNSTGIIGLGLTGLGFVGFGALHLLKQEARRRQDGTEVQQYEGPHVRPGGEGPRIPSHGKPQSPHVELRLLDADGAPVGIDTPLITGQQYRLELTLRPGGRPKERDDGQEERHQVNVTGRSLDLSVEPVLQFGFSGTPLSIEIPLTPRRQGKQELALDVTSRGHLLQRERLTVSVVGSEGQHIPGPPQTTTTVFSASDLSSSDLAERAPRALLVILESDEDGSVDARVLDPQGNPVIRFDSLLQAEAIAKAANDMRTLLKTQLQSGPGMLRPVPRDDLERMLVPLVKAGRQLHLALFPRGAVHEGDVDDFASRVKEEATIQIIQNGAGLGFSTLPWNFVYDHPFQPHTKRNRICPDFPGHPPSSCPNRDAPEVMCPTGFWGARAIIEEPWVSTQTGILPPPIGTRAGWAIGYLDAELSDSARQGAALTKLGMTRVNDFDELLDSMRDKTNEPSLVYFYAHHARDQDIGTPGISIEGELLSSFTFDAIAVHWNSRPLVFVNGCASGDYELTDPLSLLDEFRRAGAVGTVTTECPLWDPLAGRLGEQVLNRLARGDEIGTVLRELRLELLNSHNNLLGFVYRLQVLSETTAQFGNIPLVGEDTIKQTGDRQQPTGTTTP